MAGTATDWVREKMQIHGKTWCRENYQAMVLECGNPVSSETYCRLIRRVSSEFFDVEGGVDHEPRPEVVMASDVATPDQAVDYHRLDLSKMRITGARVNTWGSKSNSNRQVRLELKTNDHPDPNDMAKAFLAAINDFKPPKPSKPPVIESDDYLLEMEVLDAHFGQLSWGAETGGGDYDMKIAAKAYLEVVNDILEWGKRYSVGRILFVVGSDFFNSDKIGNTTTAGTPQDEDSRWMKTFQRGFELVRDSICLCREIAPVDVVVIRGNHDTERAFYLGVALEAWFRNDKAVTIDNSALTYKVKQWGKCLIGLTHGDKGKIAGLPLLMATRWPELWAHTRHREFHYGHGHSESVKEYPGCICRQTRALAAPGAWSASEGYDSGRGSNGFLWHKELGNRATIHVSPKL